MERAMDKIRDEMAESNRPEIQAAGSCITKLLRRFPMIAGAILADGKTLNGYYEAMRDKATIRVRSAYERILAEFNGIAEIIPRMAEAEQAKYRKAFACGLRRMAEQFEGEERGAEDDRPQ